MCSIGDADCKPYHTALKMLHSESKDILKLHLNLHPLTISKLAEFQWLKLRPSGFLPDLRTVALSYKGMMETVRLHQFFVFRVRDFRFWLLAYVLISFNCAKFQQTCTTLILDIF